MTDKDEDDAVARAARARKGSPFLSTAQAAWYLGLDSRTLDNMRGRGEGPRARRHGRYVRYHIDDLDHWSLTVRRRNIWRRFGVALTESGPRQGLAFRRRACGAASGDVRWSVS